MWVEELLCPRARSRGARTRSERARARCLGPRRVADDVARGHADDPALVSGPDSGSATRGRRAPWLCARIASSLLDAWGDRSVETRDVLRRICEYWEPQARIDRQYAGVRATAAIVCSDFAAPAIARTSLFRLRARVPRWTKSTTRVLNFARLVWPVDGARDPCPVPAREGRPRYPRRHFAQGEPSSRRCSTIRTAPGRQGPSARRLCRATSSTASSPPIPLTRGAELPGHLSLVRGRVHARMPVGRKHRARARSRGRVAPPGRERGRDPVEQHGLQDHLSLDRSEDREPRRRPLSAPPWTGGPRSCAARVHTANWGMLRGACRRPFRETAASSFS